MVKDAHSQNYVGVEVTTFLDAPDLRDVLPAQIRQFADNAAENDFIILFAAGHGIRDDASGKFYLVTRESQLDDLVHTAIAWTDIATALGNAKARVIVFLDACQSGSVESSTNDDAVSMLLNRKMSIAVIAASKGRQDSLEDEALGSGIFTSSLIRSVVNWSTTDLNHNGVVELSELYGAVKRAVLAATNGKQTPWIARNLMVGEAPLF